MNDAVQALGATPTIGLTETARPGLPTAAGATGFAGWVDREFAALDGQLLRAEQGMRSLATGSAENLHDVMLQMEQARLALQLALQVRSRVIEAYQEVMRMQV